jgi:hypothetical protein
MIKKGEEYWNIQIDNAGGSRLDPMLVPNELQQETKSVAVTGNGL